MWAPGGERLYENSNIPKIAICVVVTFSCLPDNNKYYSKGASLHQVTVTTVRHNPQAFLIKKHGSRLGEMSRCCNCSTTNPSNSPDRNHGTRLEVMSDGSVGTTPQYMY